jgi:hypothetical protein
VLQLLIPEVLLLHHGKSLVNGNYLHIE